MTAASGVEVIQLFPDEPAHADILQAVQTAFAIDEDAWGYELKLRESLTDIWLKLFELIRPNMKQDDGRAGDAKIKKMMIYIHEHYQEPISIEKLAQAVPVSKRACFRLFQENLHMTPVEYIRSYRLQKACQLLMQNSESITQIAYLCGLGSSSYFGKVFREKYQCTPVEYRRRWHDHDNFVR